MLKKIANILFAYSIWSGIDAFIVTSPTPFVGVIVIFSPATILVTPVLATVNILLSCVTFIPVPGDTCVWLSAAAAVTCIVISPPVFVTATGSPVKFNEVISLATREPEFKTEIPDGTIVFISAQVLSPRKNLVLSGN